MKTGIIFLVVFQLGFFVNGQSINDRTAILDLINNYSRYDIFVTRIRGAIIYGEEGFLSSQSKISFRLAKNH